MNLSFFKFIHFFPSIPVAVGSSYGQGARIQFALQKEISKKAAIQEPRVALLLYLHAQKTTTMKQEWGLPEGLLNETCHQDNVFFKHESMLSPYRGSENCVAAFFPL